MPTLPEIVFHSLGDIQKAWGVSFSDIKQWLIHEHLRAHVWLPMVSVYEIREETLSSKVVLSKKLRHWEGYTQLDPHYYWKLFKSNKVYLREFFCYHGDARLLLTEATESIRIDLSDLVILNEERRRFEAEHHLNPESICDLQKRDCRRKFSPKTQSTTFCPEFRKVKYLGQDYNFGDIQAKVVRQLYEAALTGYPWQNGKQLLADAGSQSFTIANIFKTQPLWRRLIISDKRGFYRLEEDFILSLTPK